MTKYYVNEIVQDKETQKLVKVTIDLETYCSLLSSKIFTALNRFEEVSGMRVSDDYELKTNLFDAIGLSKRLPNNIYVVGDDDERL